MIANLRRLLPPAEGSSRSWMRKETLNTYPMVPMLKHPMRPPPQRRLTYQELSWWYMLPAEQLTEQWRSHLKASAISRPIAENATEP